jgi:two-component sensor histidine kinase
MTGGPDLSLTWTETGGPPVRDPTHQGYGTRYISSALRSLFGTIPEIDFAPAGFRCSVRGPMSRIVPQNQTPRGF